MLKRIASISQNEQGDILNINDVISPKKGPEQILEDLLHLLSDHRNLNQLPKGSVWSV